MANANKTQVQPNPQFLTDAQKDNQVWTETTGSVQDSAGGPPPTGPRKKTNAGPLKTNARRKTTKRRSGA